MPLPGPPSNYMNFRGIAYAEVEGSPEGNLYFDRGALPRNIHVSWEQVDAAVHAFMGSVYTSPTTPLTAAVITNVVTGARTISRVVPHAFPTRPWMYVQGINHIKPMGMRAALEYDEYGNPINPNHGTGNKDDGTGMARYAMAEIGLQYAMPAYKIKSDLEVTNNVDGQDLQGYPDEGFALATGYTNSRYITRQIKRASKMLTVPKGIIRGSDNKLILESVAITEHVATYEYTWFQVPEEALPELTWIEAANTVNHDTFDGRPAGTLLFAGEPEVRHEPSPVTGQHLYSVKYTFNSLLIYDGSGPSAVVRGHNYIRKVIANKIVPVLFSADGAGNAAGTRIFRDFDFAKFFRPDPVTP